jgi:hypothetical protein
VGVYPHPRAPLALATFCLRIPMAHNDIPKNVRRLIVRQIESVQQVEILALLRADRERVWAPDEVSRRLHINSAACDAWLRGFAAANLVDRIGDGYQHAARGPSVRAADELVDCFARRRLAVIDAIYSKVT